MSALPSPEELNNMCEAVFINKENQPVVDASKARLKELSDVIGIDADDSGKTKLIETEDYRAKIVTGDGGTTVDIDELQKLIDPAIYKRCFKRVFDNAAFEEQVKKGTIRESIARSVLLAKPPVKRLYVEKI